MWRGYGSRGATPPTPAESHVKESRTGCAGMVPAPDAFDVHEDIVCSLIGNPPLRTHTRGGVGRGS